MAKKRKARNSVGTRRVRVFRFLGWAALLGFAISLLLVVPLRWIDPPTSAFMLRDRLGGVAVNQEWVAWDRIGTALPIAVVASEDQKFPIHHGFDLESMQDALEGGAGRGASTITQQVAKNLYLWPGRSWVRKGIEAWLTLLIEVTWPKRRILEVYLNIAEFGAGIWGVGAATNHYFGLEPDRISLDQAARLATVLPSPKRIDPTGGSDYVSKRGAWIIAQVRGLGGYGYLAEIDRPR
jgi:monofunctional biosynthetic peptidoglycan transglycosylase